MIHRSKRDGWQGGLMAVAVLALATVGGAAVAAGGALRASGGVVLLVLATLLAWSALAIEYQVTEREIQVRSGPWCWRVPLEGILRVYPARDPRWGPAGSLDRLRIDYRSNGKPALLSLSPEDKFAFLADLAEV